jgi:hypothetical protein
MQRHDLPPAPRELLDEIQAEEPGAAGDEGERQIPLQEFLSSREGGDPAAGA